MPKLTHKMILKCVDEMHDGFMISDRHGNIMYCNEAYWRLTKIEDDGSGVINLSKLRQEGVMEKEPACITAAREKRTISRLHAQVNNNIYIIVNSEPVFDENGNVSMVMTSVRDVTEFFDFREGIDQARKILSKFEKDIDLYTKYGEGIIAVDPAMQELLDMAKKVAVFDVPVLILGASGTGKEVVAKYVHDNSSRSDGPFVAVNCAAIPDNLLESELFGYAEGTFTGQVKTGKKGLFEAARRGTLFLDEIGDMPLNLQAKLLRVLETKTYSPLGSHKLIETDVRILSATNQDLRNMVEDKKFREDLYYRLNVVRLTIPALKERTEDILPLCLFFLNQLNKKYHMDKQFSPIAMKALNEYVWPGNVRELKNLVEMMMVTSSGDILEAPDYVLSQKNRFEVVHQEQEEELEPLNEYMGKKESEYLIKVLDRCKSTKKMAEVLQIDHSTVLRKIKKYEIPI